MTGMLSNLQALVAAMQVNMLFVLALIGIMWAVNIVNWLFLGGLLNILGVLPRHPLGLIGIIFSPFLHGHFNHLFFNTFPLFVLMNLVMLGGLSLFYAVTLIVVVGSGVLVWLFGRRAIHLGASSLIMGYWGYLLVHAYTEGTIMAGVLGAVSLYYFGGLLMELFPDRREVSWEGHLFGFLSGLAAVPLGPKLVPYLYPMLYAFKQV